MPENRLLLERFVRSYLSEIKAEVTESEGVLEVSFPPGRKRRFGKTRKIAFDPERRGPHVEVLEPGSPLLKAIVEDAQTFGGVSAAFDPRQPPGTLLYTFRAVLHSGLTRQIGFLWARLAPGSTVPQVETGLPPIAKELPGDAAAQIDLETVRRGLKLVVPLVQAKAIETARPGTDKARETFQKGAERVAAYYQGLRQEAFLKEARFRKRLGEIQSKLYFTEDGLRQIKLEEERDRILESLRKIRLENQVTQDKISDDEQAQMDRQVRRHEPKLYLDLIAVTLLSNRGATQNGT